MESSPQPQALLERIAHLEQAVESLTLRLDAHVSPGPSPAPPTAAAQRERADRWALRGEQWTGRAGLALLFLGLVFLFQYSVEQGWITPVVRVLFGVALGGGFLSLGLRLRARRPTYGALLLAGAIACFYATGWAASQLYALVEHPVALAWMAAVTLLALALARGQDQPALASLGAMGGLATPFLLSAEPVGVVELTVYATLVVLWTAALYLERGWRSVLWTFAAGGLAVLSVAATSAGGGERWVVLGSLLLTWALGVAGPFLREARGAGSDDPHPRALLPFALELRLLGVGGSAAALWVADRLWAFSDTATGALFLALALGYAAFAWAGTRTPNFVARAAAPVAAALCATGTFLLLEPGPARWWAVGLQAFAFVYGGASPRLRGLEWVGHGLFGLLSLSLLRQLFLEPAAAFDALAWAHLGGVVLAAWASAMVRPAWMRWTYRITAHALLLAWLASEFEALRGGTEWVTLAWGLYGGGLLLAALQGGRRRGRAWHALQMVAGSALALTVLKLLIVDLSETSALVRVALFLGTGAALLGLSALFHRPGGHAAERTGAPPLP